MCEPTTIAAAALAVSAGSQVAGAITEHVAQNKAFRANENAANSAASVERQALGARATEEIMASGQQLEEGQRQAVSASATARLSAVSAGVAGQSADAVLNQIQADQGRYASSVKQNLDLTLLQIDRQGLGIEAQRIARINSKAKANPWATGLTITKAVADYATQKYGGKP